MNPAGIGRDAMMRHVRYLTEQCALRFSGTAPQKKAAQYIFDQLNASGIDVRMEEFFGYGSVPVSGTLEILFPQKRQVDCEVVCYSRDLADAEYPLEDLGAGTQENFRHADLRGKVALVNAYEGPGTPEKARMAQSRGAAGMILITWPAPVKNVATYRAFKGIWGNPDRTDKEDIPSLCAVSVGHQDGLRLRKECRDGSVTVRLHGQCATGWVRLYEPVAVIRAPEPTEEFLLVTGHVDAWARGASDNATGVALMIELARYFHEAPGQLKRNVVFVFYDGHEVLEATGSSCIAERFWDKFRDHGVMEMNIDSPGLVGASSYRTFANFELMDDLKRIHEEIGLGEKTQMLPITRDSDRSYLALGLPGFLTVEDGESEGPGIPFSWWCHTSEDTLDKLDGEMLERTAAVFVRYILEFAGSNRIPFSVARPMQALSRAAEDCVTACGERLSCVDFSSVIAGMRELCALYGELDRRRGRDSTRLMPLYRRVLQRMAPVLYTASGRYRQDHYGDIRCEKTAPLLEPLRAMAETEPGSEKFFLLYTECLRVRNILSDFVKISKEEVGAWTAGENS